MNISIHLQTIVWLSAFLDIVTLLCEEYCDSLHTDGNCCDCDGSVASPTRNVTVSGPIVPKTNATTHRDGSSNIYIDMTDKDHNLNECDELCLAIDNITQAKIGDGVQNDVNNKMAGILPQVNVTQALSPYWGRNTCCVTQLKFEEMDCFKFDVKCIRTLGVTNTS